LHFDVTMAIGGGFEGGVGVFERVIAGDQGVDIDLA
jgi:hypothetical protein